MFPTGKQIIYTNICTDNHMDLLSSYKHTGFESDLIIREQLPDPAAYGFPDSSKVRVQWLNKFFNPPSPQLIPSALPDGSVDEVVDFGAFKMLPGKGFFIGKDTPDQNRVRVLKQWTVIEG